MRARLARRTVLSTLLAVAACGTFGGDQPDGAEQPDAASQSDAAQASACSLDVASVALPGALVETSGVAASLRSPDLFWTHNDRGYGSFLYSVDRDGRIRGRVELDQPADDWEDIDRGPCDLGTCLYVAGTGDNNERRETISLYRLAEPDGEGERAVQAELYRMALPDGPRDIEAMYVLPDEQIFFVTKGRNHPITVYRYPSPLRADEVVTLVEVQRLTDDEPRGGRQVTGASATLDGGTVAIRTYQSLEFFDVGEDGRLVETEEGRVDLRPLRERQGEGIGFTADGGIVLTSETGGGSPPSMRFLTCELD